MFKLAGRKWGLEELLPFSREDPGLLKNYLPSPKMYPFLLGARNSGCSHSGLSRQIQYSKGQRANHRSSKSEPWK